MRDKYKERVRIEKMRMLNEILSASKPKDKRAVVTRFNPYFYLMFHDGVKSYEQSEMKGVKTYDKQDSQDFGVQALDDETAEVELRLDSDRKSDQAYAEGGH